MSADFINGLGSRGPQFREAYGVGSRPAVGAGEKTAGVSSVSQNQGATETEGFSPTSEAGETQQDRQAGEARASQFSSAWGPVPPSSNVSAGQLSIQGAENTGVAHQVHGVNNGQHVGAAGPDAGFSEATVYKSGPPG